MTLICLSQSTVVIAQEAATTQPTVSQVSVELKSGRVFAAAVDRRSDDRLLWLRFQASSTIILRPIEWSHVVAAELDGRKMTASEFQASLDDIATTHKFWAPGDAPTQRSADHPQQTDARRSSQTDAQRAAEALAIDRRVRSIQVDAFVANWDATVESDGLIVHVYPLDAEGHLLEVDATADLSLIGVTGSRRPSPSGRARATDRRFPTIGSWTRAVKSDRFGLTGVSLRLPFGAVHPEFNPHIRNQALLHVKLSIPGHGVFEATTEPVTIRPMNPIRDRVDAVHGTRFLPTESIGR